MELERSHEPDWQAKLFASRQKVLSLLAPGQVGPGVGGQKRDRKKNKAARAARRKNR